MARATKGAESEVDDVAIGLGRGKPLCGPFLGQQAAAKRGGGEQPDLLLGCEGRQVKDLSIRERVMVVAHHSVHVDTGKHVSQHGDGSAVTPENRILPWDSSCWSARMPSSRAGSMYRFL